MRIVIAEDSVLLRAGLTRLLVEAGEEVVSAVGDATALLEAVERNRPDIVIADVRMPPTHTDEGIRAAVTLRQTYPEIAVLVLSQYVEERYAVDLIAGDTAGVGYLLKDRVADVSDFLDAVRRVGSGGTALDPEVVSQLLARSRQRDPVDRLTDREREVLGLMAEGAVEQRHRRGPRGERRCGREARPQHLHEARPLPRRRRPPPGAGRPPLPGLVSAS